MLTYNTLFETTLRKLIQEEIERQTENLVLGLSVTDFSAYREAVGRIAGMRQALDLCEEAQTIISKI